MCIYIYIYMCVCVRTHWFTSEYSFRWDWLHFIIVCYHHNHHCVCVCVCVFVSESPVKQLIETFTPKYYRLLAAKQCKHTHALVEMTNWTKGALSLSLSLSHSLPLHVKWTGIPSSDLCAQVKLVLCSTLLYRSALCLFNISFSWLIYWFTK